MCETALRLSQIQTPMRRNSLNGKSVSQTFGNLLCRELSLFLFLETNLAAGFIAEFEKKKKNVQEIGVFQPGIAVFEECFSIGELGTSDTLAVIHRAWPVVRVPGPDGARR